jgi:hypothetical protein
MLRRNALVIAAFISISLASGHRIAYAGFVNVANNAPIIGGGGDGEAGAYNSTTSNFSTDNVTDGQNASPDNNTGTLTEAFADDSYWLGPTFSSTGYFVIDLGAATNIVQVHLFNTSNGHARDRGTGNFTVKASNSITAGPAGTGMDLVSPVTLVSSTLLPGNHTATAGQQAVLDQLFIPSDTLTAYRYVRFDALSILTPSGSTSGNGTGLDEIRLLVPEPTSAAVVMLFGCAAVSRAAGRRRG